MREYKKYEFCKSVKCHELAENVREKEFKCIMRTDRACTKRAKEFHTWLVNNGFKIIKTEKDSCPDCEHYGGMTPDCMAPSFTPCPIEQSTNIKD